MNTSSTSGKLLGVGVLSSIAASLCCITPILALIASTSGIASTFLWFEPARPYFIGLSIAVLAFAWYQKLKPVPADDCGCAVDEKPKFIQSKSFIVIISFFATLMMAFPYYSIAFFPKVEKQIIIVEKSNIQTAEFTINGMSCAGCEEEVKHEVNKLNGIIKADVSYASRNALIQFDNSKTDIPAIEKAIKTTGYTVTKTMLK